MAEVALRAIEDADLDAVFEQMRDPESMRMAAFTSANPDNRPAFDRRMASQRASPEITMRAVTHHGRLVGTIACFVIEGETEVTYWIDRAAWGRGIATAALALFLELVPHRPLYARAATDNGGSLKVLHRAGFTTTGTERSHAPARGSVIEETLLRLD